MGALLLVAALVVAVASPAGGAPAAATTGQAQAQGVTLQEELDGSGLTPRVGMQDGWSERPGSQGCDGDAPKTGPHPPHFVTSIPPAFQDSGWSAEDVHYLRLTVPWDIAYTNVYSAAQLAHDPAAHDIDELEQVCMSWWLTLAEKAHESCNCTVEPEIQFRPDAHYDGRKYLNGSWQWVHVMPSIHEYSKAMAAFTAMYTCLNQYGGPATTCPLPPAPADKPASWAYPDASARMIRVHVVAPWGEPDFPPGDNYMPKGDRLFQKPGCNTGVNRCGPVLAAHMWQVVNRDCKQCIVIAGTFSDFGGLAPFGGNLKNTYLGEYASHLGGHRPAFWALDNYGDVSHYEWACYQLNGGASDVLYQSSAQFQAYVSPSNHNPNLNPPSNLHYANCSSSPAQFKPCPASPASDIWQGQFSGQYTLLCRFSKALDDIGYHGKTHIWLGEISAFNVDMFHNKAPAGQPADQPWYGWDVANQATHYLVADLCKPGKDTPSNAPPCTRLYYMRYSDGAGFPNWSAVLDNATGGYQAGVAPGSEWYSGVYWAIRFRPSPQQ